MINPNEDGITHINVYSKGKTILGMMLSNFYRINTRTPDGIFASIEGYWYYLGTNHPHKEQLRAYYGAWAKKLGKEFCQLDPLYDPEFESKIKAAITNKLQQRSIRELLEANTLPLEHYYVYNGHVVKPKGSNWVIEHIRTIAENVRK